MTNQIVTVNVSQQIAPTPNRLQQTGAFVSLGATTLPVGTSGLITQMSDLTAILAAANPITAAVWSGGTVTVTAANHGITVGQTVSETIAGMTPAAYNGTFNVTATSANQFTYSLASNPGSATVFGTVVPAEAQELVAMATTFFAQGSANSVYVLELGELDNVTGIAALSTYLQNPSRQFYSYLVPRAWSGEATFVTLANNYTSTTAKTYFYVTVTQGNYSTWTNIKSAILLIEDASVPATEFSIAAMFWKVCNYNPSTTNKVTPMCFAFVYGVTANTLSNTVKTQLKAANVNFISTGAEGGISNKIVQWGVTGDGRDVTYWYAVDWLQINLDLDLSNELINGSNNPVNPLYYNQQGIERLKKRAQATTDRGITYGMVLSPATVDAVSFIKYTTDNPSDYPLGLYNGLSLTAVPARGFTQLIFNLVVTDFITA